MTLIICKGNTQLNVTVQPIFNQVKQAIYCGMQVKYEALQIIDDLFFFLTVNLSFKNVSHQAHRSLMLICRALLNKHEVKRLSHKISQMLRYDKTRLTLLNIV